MVVKCGCFFFQAEDGIRDIGVTGVQTCALPIYCLIMQTNPNLYSNSLDETACMNKYAPVRKLSLV